VRYRRRSDLGGGAAEFGHDPGLPELAHDEQFVGLGNRARLPIAEAGILKAVDMVNGARKAPDQAALLQGRQRITRDRILRMKDVELPMVRQLEMFDVVGDARLHHFRDVLARR
jgi:hypothetical protein